MALDDDVALLEGIPLLQALGRDALRILAIGGEARNLHAGEILFREGEDAEGGYVVVSGSIGLKSMLEPERGEFVAAAGTLIGETALLTEVRRPCTAIAREPSAVLRIPRHTFRRTLEGYPSAARTLQAALAERLAETSRALGKVRHRLEVIDKVPRKPDWA